MKIARMKSPRRGPPVIPKELSVICSMVLPSKPARNARPIVSIPKNMAEDKETNM